MKKALITIGIFSVFLIGFLIFNGNDKDQNPVEAQIDNGMEDHLFGENLIVDAKMPEFPDLDTVEENSDIIIVGKKVQQQDPTVLYGPEGRINIAYTLSSIRIEKVISGEAITEGTEITILENSAYNAKIGYIYNIAGYELMQTNNEYLLFLRASTTDPYYLVTGVNYGKVPLQEEKSALFTNLKKANSDYAKEVLSNIEEINLVREEALKKYASSIK
jgi:hypothetical protein